MAVSAEFQGYVVELLEPIGPVQAKRMFGGAGLYLDGTI
ncbi:MAG: TfoX/Sxy family protein, partial [Magnetovibrio sp.]|nr:TfoX/Sxy family protein [Magnetovibrio sp.]